MATFTGSNKFKFNLLNSITNHTLIAVLMKSTYNPDITTIANFNTLTDISANIISSAGGYTSKTLANKVITEDDTNKKAYLSCDNFSWSANGAMDSFNAMVLYDSSASNAIIGYYKFDQTYSLTDGSTFTIANFKIEVS